ncbi:MAG: hypothetical protein M0P31_11275 [Solirubrobacteraceae bacterium]|nr:hypothetical protein [Solirubrobacteraceae bacterium]
MDEEFPNEYSGMWPNEAAGRITVAVTDDVPTSAITDAASDADLVGKVDVVRRPNTWDELQTALETVDADLLALIESGKVQVELDPEGGRVIVTQASSLDVAERALVATSLSGIDVPSHVVDDPALEFSIEPLACAGSGRFGCDWP